MSPHTRAQALLGTVVTIEVDGATPAPTAHTAIGMALAVMSQVSKVMSAHRGDSDLGRISRASAGQTLHVDPHTVRVLMAAQHWSRRSRRAFDPVRAGSRLAQAGARPGLNWGPAHGEGLNELIFEGEDAVRLLRPLAIDLGGMAKGYAVDQALAVLQSHGVQRARVNAGGDVGLLGSHPQRLCIRHAGADLRDGLQLRQRLHCGGLATSVADAHLAGFVATGGVRRPAWRSASVWAGNCMTADMFTKWALQASPLCPELRSALRSQNARMWRST
jgi:thiamine biosynthesis lipoprotein